MIAALGDHYRRRELGSTVRCSKISEAISGADGEDWHKLLHPVEDLEFGEFQIPVMGGVTFYDP